MAYGIAVTKGSLTTLTQTLTSGRIYIDLIYYETETSGTTHTHTYTAVPGHSYLRIHQIGGGTHTWTTSTNGSGQAVITLTATANPSTLAVPFTLLVVFTTRTSETGYGITTVNEVGDTVVSALYPVPEFVGKVTFSSTPTSSYATGEGSFNRYVHTTGTTLGASRERLLFWVLPQTNEDVWYNCPAHISASVSGSFNIEVQVTTLSGTAYYLPECYVFALNGLTASSEAYGMRVFDAAGAVTFDSGRDHLVITGIDNIVDFPTSTGTINSYVPTTDLTGINYPAGTFPQFRQETYNSSGAKVYSGAVRLRTNQVETRLVQDAAYGGSYSTATYNYGLYTDLTQAYLNSADYATTSFALTGRTFQYDGTNYCAYDTSLSQTSCTSVSYHSSAYRGGVGAAVTYAWSLPSNAGGLSISGSTTSIDCKVEKTTAAAGTYSATLRCAISDGISTTNIDRSITHTHEAVSSGGGSGGDTGGDSGGDSGDGGGGGCVMATYLTQTGVWSRTDLLRLVRWCERTLHGRAAGECFRRGYKVIGTHIGVPGLRRGGLSARYFRWTFEGATDLLRRRTKAPLVVLNSACWFALIMVVGALKK